MPTRIDMRKVLRRIGRRVQRAQVSRLRNGTLNRGGRVEPLDGDTVRQGGTRPGVRTGSMANDLARPGALRITKTGFRISPSASQRIKWEVYNRGKRGQAARPVGGITSRDFGMAARDIAKDGRQQIVRGMNRGLVVSRVRGRGARR